ncbi:MAG: DUF5676 family membrane protein [Burkholderiales bacterium]
MSKWRQKNVEYQSRDMVPGDMDGAQLRVCVVYGLLTPSGVHMSAFLLQVLPGYELQSWRGFLVGLIQSFLYGSYAGLVYVPVYNFLHRRWVKH